VYIDKWFMQTIWIWPQAANKMFLQWCGDVLPKVYIFVQRLVSGTGRGFASAPLKKHKRCAQGGKMGSGDRNSFSLLRLYYRTG
jgi:hypothetical protein